MYQKIRPLCNMRFFDIVIYWRPKHEFCNLTPDLTIPFQTRFSDLITVDQFFSLSFFFFYFFFNKNIKSSDTRSSRKFKNFMSTSLPVKLSCHKKIEKSMIELQHSCFIQQNCLCGSCESLRVALTFQLWQNFKFKFSFFSQLQPFYK